MLNSIGLSGESLAPHRGQLLLFTGRGCRRFVLLGGEELTLSSPQHFWAAGYLHSSDDAEPTVATAAPTAMLAAIVATMGMNANTMPQRVA